MMATSELRTLLRPYTQPRRAPTTATPFLERLASGIDYRGDGQCWEWQGARSRNGYGCLSIDDRSRYVHRVVYELLVGPIPAGLHIDHLCRVRSCCNPAHLEPVTNRVNVLRGVRSVATHCKRGHEFTAENTYIRLDRPERVCRECKRLGRAMAAIS